MDLQSRFGGETLEKLGELAYFIPDCIVQSQNDAAVDYASLLKSYFRNEPASEFKLRGEIAFWRQKWTRQQTKKPKEALLQTAADSLAACDKQAFPLLLILFTLPVSTASAERSFSTLRRLKTWLRSRMGEERLTGLALSNIHRDIPVSTDDVINRFAKTQKRFLDFVI